MERRSALARRKTVLTRAARRVAAVFAEISYAQHRIYAIRTNPDRYLVKPDQVPESYPDFLFRTSGMLLHEPTAARRAHGRLVG